MMFPILQRVCRVITMPMRSSLNGQIQAEWNNLMSRRLIHAIQPLKSTQGIYDINLANKSPGLLASTNVQYTQTCGMKVLGKVHRRCKDCCMMLKNGIMYNYCKAHPRHNQRAKTARPKSTWILTGVTRSKVRPW
ncbi:uncharacterized protein LOC116348456 [Contarinia nasturtii]|uniref:uncharacterized protein LOC116348456 n=1 Tax=Contarinia nasturtii TaxID=265458 RepID=UPI0012D45A36|nr:uncharacterized protein LOC116348456 [Contarinia nasturtii]